MVGPICFIYSIDFVYHLLSYEYVYRYTSYSSTLIRNNRKTTTRCQIHANLLYLTPDKIVRYLPGMFFLVLIEQLFVKT